MADYSICEMGGTNLLRINDVMDVVVLRDAIKGKN